MIGKRHRFEVTLRLTPGARDMTRGALIPDDPSRWDADALALALSLPAVELESIDGYAAVPEPEPALTDRIAEAIWRSKNRDEAFCRVRAILADEMDSEVPDYVAAELEARDAEGKP